MKGGQLDYQEFKLEGQAHKQPSKPEAELSHEEHEKITNLCNVYGLNEEETRQLIEELKAGGNISIEQNCAGRISSDRRQSSIVSMKNEELSFNDSEFRFEEEYSFKQHGQRRASVSSNGDQQQLERMLAAKMKHQEEFIDRLKSENEILKAEKQDLSAKIATLLKMKEQETEIMLGLKNTICSLTNLLSDKDQAYNQLQQAYARLAERVDRKSLNSNDKQNWVGLQQSSSTMQIRPASTNKPEKRDSRQNILTEGSVKDSNIERKSSKEFSKNKSTTNFHGNNTGTKPNPPAPQQQMYIQNVRQQQKQDNANKQSFSKKQKIDISKYKVFIDELRNICVNKQKP